MTTRNIAARNPMQEPEDHDLTIQQCVERTAECLRAAVSALAAGYDKHPAARTVRAFAWIAQIQPYCGDLPDEMLVAMDRIVGPKGWVRTFTPTLADLKALPERDLSNLQLAIVAAATLATQMAERDRVVGIFGTFHAPSRELVDDVLRREMRRQIFDPGASEREAAVELQRPGQ